MRTGYVATLLVAMALICTVAGAVTNSSEVAAMDKKLRHIESNGALAHPDPTPTELTEDEVNAYFASGNMELPAGVRSVKFQGNDGTVIATTDVDFDRLKGNTGSSNLLLSIFSRIHTVIVNAHARGSGGEGFVQIDSVALDGTEIPRFVLQLFVDKYIQPKYPDLGLDSQFKLPNRISTATVGVHRLIIVQK